jgi:hypothetical protein
MFISGLYGTDNDIVKKIIYLNAEHSDAEEFRYSWDISAYEELHDHYKIQNRSLTKHKKFVIWIMK